jgi:hypothetical protein
MSGDDRGDLGDHRKKQHFSLSTEKSSGGSSYGEILQSLSPMWCAWRTGGSIYRFALGLMLLRIATV